MTEQTQAHSEEMTRAEIEMRFLGKALQDDAFKQALLTDPIQIWQQEMGNTFLKDWQLQVLEDTADTLHLVVPYQDDQFRQELQQHPAAVWKQEFGTDRLEGYVIRVVEEAQNQFYLVLPWQDASLPALVFPPLPSAPTTTVPSDTQPQSQSFFSGKRLSLQRPMPKTKLGRLFYRMGGWVELQAKSNPVVTTIMRPVQEVRRWFFWWQRL